MSERLRICISPCPNDTFAFFGLLSRRVDPRGFAFEFEFADVQDANRRLADGEFDAGKMSFAAAVRATDEFALVASGSALGFGVGPLLLGRRGVTRLEPGARIVAPGADTTAALLLRLFHPDARAVEHRIFSAILPLLERGEFDAGVCIHEGRFTWEGRGLECIEDLGASWEARTSAPLPLGGILARRSLGRDRGRRLAEAVRDSIDFAESHRGEALAVMRAHAQELSDAVLWQHVALYVTRDTHWISEAGRRALARFADAARECGWAPSNAPPLEIWGD